MTDDRPKEQATMTTHHRNAWLSWKRVRRTPPLGLLATITTRTGRRAQLAVSDAAAHSALYVREDATDTTLRVDLSTLVESVLGSEAREAERWQPLVLCGHTPDGDELWGNDLLTVTKRTQEDDSVVLSYHWRDRAPIRDWRVGQRVKNELVGAEAEGIELYPAESRLMDEANEYWLLVFPEDHPAHEVFQRLGSPERTVMTQAELDEQSRRDGVSGAVQRDDDGLVLR